MNRISITVTLAMALLVGACGGTPSSSAGAASPSAASTPDLAKAAHDQVCNPEGGGSFSKVAIALDKLGATADTTQLQATLGTLLLNLQQLQVDPTAKPALDAAGTSIAELERSLNDSSKRQQAVTNAATALRAAEAAVCK